MDVVTDDNTDPNILTIVQSSLIKSMNHPLDYRVLIGVRRSYDTIEPSDRYTTDV